MIVDAASPEREDFGGDFDLCVVGTGPAGITLARALAAKGFRIALMEAGGLDWSSESQDIYQGESVGADFPPLDQGRLRYFGGSSNHWAGFSGALAAAKFRPRPQNPLSGWPIGGDDLTPYREEAERILDIVPAHRTPAPPAAPDASFRPLDFSRSAPTRVGEKYRDEIAGAAGIVLGLHANLVDLRLDESLGRVEAAVFRSYAADDPGFMVRARVFCLCAGGIENARLLLNFRSQIPVGIGNEHDLVGRFFCDTLRLVNGEMIFEENPGTELQFFGPSEDFIAAHGTLDLVARVTPRPRSMSLIREGLREAQCLPFVERLAEAVLGERAARCDTGGLWDYWQSRDPERYPWAVVSLHAEQALNPDSRVALSDERDAFGMFRPRIDWRLSEVDLHSVRTSTLAFAAYVADSGLGRMRIYDWVLADPPAFPAISDGHGNLSSDHHMCTTRMSADPRQGVVDGNCRVHATRNLYVGGSSVFASGGFPPTFSIVQLALRLADHLEGELAGRG